MNPAPPPPFAVLPLSHEPAAGERRSLLGDGGDGAGPGPLSSSSGFVGFDGVAAPPPGGGGLPTSASPPSAAAVSPAIAAKVDRALLPALCTLTLVNYLDR